MIAKILKKTGEYETVPVEVTNEQGVKETVDQQREILEEVQAREFTEGEKAHVMKSAALRAALLTRDTGYKHVVDIT